MKEGRRVKYRYINLSLLSSHPGYHTNTGRGREGEKGRKERERKDRFYFNLTFSLLI